MKMMRDLLMGVCFIAVAAHAGTPLVDLKPTKVEFGMIEEVGPPWGLATGSGVIDLGTWGGRQHMPWPDAQKIVAKIKPDQKLPEGQPYSSFMPDVVAIQGDFRTGVCLLAMSNGMYHWYEYAIPTGAKRFTAKLYLTDDVGGRIGHVVAGVSLVNQDVIIRISADGQQLYERHYNRMNVGMGSGELIDTVALDLPADAKTIRFYFQSTTFPNNLHNELLIADGVFE
ncbi:MAG: hypothetical protein N3A53_00335 [Verrucomicrobiae bacterium]|nr:hypothetical protein [Verrucomicrobiae bacterium]